MKVEYIVCIRTKWYICGFETVPQKFVPQTWSYACNISDYMVALDASVLLNISRSHALGYDDNGVLHILMCTLPMVNA